MNREKPAGILAEIVTDTCKEERDGWLRRLCTGKEYPHFGMEKEVSTPDQLTAPFRYDIMYLIHAGDNELWIEIATTLDAGKGILRYRLIQRMVSVHQLKFLTKRVTV